MAGAGLLPARAGTSRLRPGARRPPRRQGAGRPAALAALPGVGAYTAAAVAAIAFDHPVVPVDGNVERVLARLVALESPLPGARRTVTAQAEALAGGGRAGDLAQALMDLGAAVCTPRRPLCLACPWRSWCVAAATGRSAELPLRAERATRPLRRGTAFLLVRPDGAMLLRRRPPTGLLGGMIDLPATPWETGAAPDDLAAHAPGPAAWCLLPGAVRHVFTHFALELRVARGDLDGAAPAGLWARPADLAALALPTLARKLLAHAGVIAAAGRGACCRAARRPADAAASAAVSPPRRRTGSGAAASPASP